MTPRVSVVVPVRNGAPFVARCVACLKAQTLRDAEFLIVDDASTDGTPERLLREIAGDGRFKVLRQAVQAGPLAARMRGVSEASAPVVMFMDFDDEIVPNACSVVAETMARNGVDVFCYAGDAVGEDGCDTKAIATCQAYLSRQSPIQGKCEDPEKCSELFLVDSGLTAASWDKAVRTSVLRRVYSMIGNGDGLLCAQDFLQTTILFLVAESILIDQSKRLYVYHYGAGMMGRRPGDVTWDQFMRRMTAIKTYRALCRVLDGMAGPGNQLREMARAKFLRSIRHSALPEVWKLPPDLVNAGLEVISREWGDDARDFAERARPRQGPAFLATLKRKIAGFIRRMAGKGKSK